MARNIMNKIFVGESASKCDGNIYGYSSLMHIIKSKPKRLNSSNDFWTFFFKMTTIGYKVDMQNNDYDFQHCYKRLSIQGYFYKDLLFSIVLVLVVVMPMMNLMTLLQDLSKLDLPAVRPDNFD